jgi:hypothetical protein
MSWLRGAVERIGRLLQRGQRPLRTERVEDLPRELEGGRIYVVGEGRHIWSVALLCPCGCGETIQLNALPEARPRWRVRQHLDGRVSLMPSVWRNTGCRSHFLVRGGVVEWVLERRNIQSSRPR